MDSRQLYVARPREVSTRRFGRGLVRHLFALAMLAGAASSGLAAPGDEAVVEQVQWPAWVETAGGRAPVRAGQILGVKDRLLTGDKARMVIRLADGSAVKLGERTELSIAALGEREVGVLTAGLEVTKGAFRFTTGLFRQILGKREVNVRFPTLTIGVRGTDFWGKTDESRELVLLIEGTIALTRPPGATGRNEDKAADEERHLAVPMNYLFSDRRGPLQERTASAQELARWAMETEPDEAQPSASPQGKFTATIAGALTRPRADATVAHLRAMGYPVDVAAFAPAVDPSSGEARKRYAVVLARLGSAEAAKVMRQTLRNALLKR